MELVTRATSGRPKGHKPPEKRPCRECASPVSSFNPSDICAGCNGGVWETGNEPTNRQLHDVEVARIEFGLAA